MRRIFPPAILANNFFFVTILPVYEKTFRKYDKKVQNVLEFLTEFNFFEKMWCKPVIAGISLFLPHDDFNTYFYQSKDGTNENISVVDALV